MGEYTLTRTQLVSLVGHQRYQLIEESDGEDQHNKIETLDKELNRAFSSLSKIWKLKLVKSQTKCFGNGKLCVIPYTSLPPKEAFRVRKDENFTAMAAPLSQQ